MRALVVLLVSIGFVGVVGSAETSASSTSSAGEGRIVFASLLPTYPLPDNFQVDRTYVVGANGGGTSELELGAVVSPDSSLYAVVRSSVALWVARVDGTAAHQVASSPSGTTISAIEWSPDGTKLAFVAGGTLWVVGSDGTDPHELFASKGLTVAGAVWSPDGSRLAVDADGEVWLARIDGATPRRLFHPAMYNGFTIEGALSLDWAPTGAALALTVETDVGCITASERCIDWYVLTFDRAGDPVGKIGHAQNVAWSPNGRRLAFETVSLTSPDSAIETARPDGSGQRRLTSASGSVCWGYPHWLNGTTVTFEAVTFDVTEDNCDPTNYPPEAAFYVVRDDRGGSLIWHHRASAEWFSRDGGEVAFIDRSRGTTALYTAAFNGRGARRLTGAATYPGDVVWSADGRRLVFTTAGCCVRDLELASAIGGPARRIVRVSANRTLYPLAIAGTRILYQSELPLSPVTLLWTMRADGSGLHRLRASATDEFDPSMSPDGNRIAFSRDTSQGGDYAVSIETVSADGTGLRRIVGAPAQVDTNPSWSPDGKKLVYLRDHSSVIVVAADGTHPHTLESAPAGSAEELSSAAWSPDGSRIAYLAGSDIMEVNPARGAPTTLLHSCCIGLGAPAWSPDGSQLAFRCTSCSPVGDGIAVIDADGSNLHLVAADRGLVNGRYPNHPPSPAWSPDGHEILFSGTSCTNDPDPAKGPPAICSVALDGTSLHPLTPPGVASFAPNAINTGAQLRRVVKSQ